VGTNVSGEHPVYIFRVYEDGNIVLFRNVGAYRTAIPCHNPGDCNMNLHRLENLKSYLFRIESEIL
jgi:hypothetical protein